MNRKTGLEPAHIKYSANSGRCVPWSRPRISNHTGGPMNTNRSMSIQIRQAHPRKSPSFLAPVAGILPYGRQVDVLGRQEDWTWVSCPQTGVTGWLHTSALSPKKIVMTDGKKEATLSTSSDEYALAGKGFNKDVEKQFRSQNPDLDFTWIDRMETFVVSASHKQTFLATGNVVPFGEDI